MDTNIFKTEAGRQAVLAEYCRILRAFCPVPWEEISVDTPVARTTVLRFGDPAEEVPGRNIILPDHPARIKATDMDLDGMRRSLIRTAMKTYGVEDPGEADIRFLAEETMKDPDWVRDAIQSIKQEGADR